EAGALCAVLDFRASFYFDGSESRDSRPRSRGASPLMGQPAARIGRLVDPLRSVLAVGSTCAVHPGGEQLSSCFDERGVAGMKKSLANFVLLALIALASVGALAQSGGELRFCLRSEPKTFNPLLAADDSSETIRYLTGGVLVRVNRMTQDL